MKIYMVILDWKCGEEADFEYHIYDSYQKALRKFKATVFDEMTDSWIANELDGDGKIDTESCEFYTNYSDSDNAEKELYWSVTAKYSFKEDNLRLDIVEVE